MLPNEYISAALRTERVPSFDIRNSGARHTFETGRETFEVHISAHTSTYDGVLGTVAVRLLHSALGMATEISELVDGLTRWDLVNVGEELGDVLWYWAVGMDALGFSTLPGEPAIDPDGLESAVTAQPLTAAICTWGDLVRRHILHGKPLSIEDARHTLFDIYRQVALLCAATRQSIATVMRRNIDKLRVRFPEKYDGLRFENRDLEAERQALECACLYELGGGGKTFTTLCPVHGHEEAIPTEMVPDTGSPK